MSDTFRYDAFISYRHRQPDKTWADWIVRALETYSPPRSLRKSLQQRGLPSRVKRVFRDDDEASAGGDLSQQLKTALEQSSHLVVICSRNTPGSRWVNQEVEYFESLGRATSVLPLLVEGDPDESFPAAIRDHTDAYLAKPQGDTATDVEPLAADVRPVTGVSRRETKSRALLKLVAGILGVRYDDLYRRDRQRRRAYMATAAITSAAISAALLGWFAWSRTDTYQVRAVLRVAPGLLASAVDDDASAWCGALVANGWVDEALAAANATDTFGGARVKALLAVADAVAATDPARSEEIASQAIDGIAGFQPSFRGELNLDAAERYAKRSNTRRALQVATSALADSTAITDIAERTGVVEKLARAIVEWQGADVPLLNGIDARASTPMNEAILAIASANTLAKSGSTQLAARRIADSFAAAGRIVAQTERANVTAYLVAETVAAGLSPPADVLPKTISDARGLSNPTAKSYALRRAVQSLALLGQGNAASSLLSEIVIQEERDEAIMSLATGFARTGRTDDAARILLDADGRNELDRYSVLSAIGDGIADGGNASSVSSYDAHLPDDDKVEIRVIVAERLRESGKDNREALDRAIEAVRAFSRDTDVSEASLRIVQELAESGRTEDALTIAREIDDPHSKAFGFIAVARALALHSPFEQLRPILEDAVSAEKTVPDADLVAAGFLEVGKLLMQAGHPDLAKALFLDAIERAAKEGETGSSTIADVVIELTHLGELRLARITADRYCVANDQLRVYAAILARYSGHDAGTSK